MEYRLLEKTELWVTPIHLDNADLNECSSVAAEIMGLRSEEIMVTDVLEDRLTFDILVPTIQAESIVSREKPLLKALASLSGVYVTDETKIHSDGILGLISLDDSSGRDVLKKTAEMSAEITAQIQRRAMVFSTGKEVLSGQIRDANTPFLIESLKSNGYDAVQGHTLEDNAQTIARAFKEAAYEGYGLVISTGGVGAESKDQTLEAMGYVDSTAVMPYILKFRKGHGRHQKDGVRLGVGIFGDTRYVCLPGPNDEVRLSWPILDRGLNENWDKHVLAHALAKRLRQKFIRGETHP